MNNGGHEPIANRVGRCYRCFGLNIDSEIPLPPLPTAKPVPTSDIDVVIRCSETAKSDIPEAKEVGAFCLARDGLLWLHVPEVARFLISEGRRIDVAPEPGGDPQTLRLYLLGSVMGALLHQRGLLVLHGNAVRFGQQAVVFCGQSAVGKSTLSAAFVKLGFQLLTDDICVVDQRGRVQPGYSELKLWQDAAEVLDIPRSGLTPIRAQIKKYAWTLQHEFHSRPLPLACIYLIANNNLEEGQLNPLKGMEKYLPLKNQTYRSRYLDGLGLTGHHLRLCGQLVGQVDITRISRIHAKLNTQSLTAQVESILADLAAKGVNVNTDADPGHQNNRGEQ